MPRKKLRLLLKVSILLSRMKKPIIPMIVSLKKTRKLKKFKLLNHYNGYNYVREYEFSPSSTPLIRFYRKPKIERLSFKKMYSSVVLVSGCLGTTKGEAEKEKFGVEMGLEPLPCVENAAVVYLPEYSFSDGDTVDERAERFIQRFYEEMRRQKQDL